MSRIICFFIKIFLEYILLYAKFKKYTTKLCSKYFHFVKICDIIQSMEKRCIVVENKKVEYFLSRKNIKNINMRISSACSLSISAPRRTTINQVEELIVSKIDWIKKTQARFREINIKRETSNSVYFLGEKYLLCFIESKFEDIKIEGQDIKVYAGDEKRARKIYDKWLRDYAQNHLTKITNKYYDKISKYVSIPMPEVEIRKMRARWGTCTPSKRKITYNLALAKTPEQCIEYVILHELTHFKHIYHNENFYNFVATFMPDWKERKILLDREYGTVV